MITVSFECQISASEAEEYIQKWLPSATVQVEGGTAMVQSPSQIHWRLAAAFFKAASDWYEWGPEVNDLRPLVEDFPALLETGRIHVNVEESEVAEAVSGINVQAGLDLQFCLTGRDLEVWTFKPKPSSPAKLRDCLGYEEWGRVLGGIVHKIEAYYLPIPGSGVNLFTHGIGGGKD